MWKYTITKVIPSETTVNFYYSLTKDGVEVKADFVLIDSLSLASQPSDGREDYIKSIIADRCKPLMVISDVKADFSGLVGVEVELETVKYETRAEREALVTDSKEII